MLEKLDAEHRLTANQWKIAFAATIGDILDRRGSTCGGASFRDGRRRSRSGFYENYVCGAPRNYTGYCNAEVEMVNAQ